MAVKPIPDGYHTITPYMIVNGSKEFIRFTKEVLGAKINHNMQHDDGTTMHAELQIGDSRVMFSEASSDNPAVPVMLYLYVTDADAIYQKAMSYGAASIMEPRDTFYGDRNAGFMDKSGNKWWVATHIKDVTEAEIAEGAKSYGKKH